jgi:transcriptional regulator with PAS, ATPase and Fis domain
VRESDTVGLGPIAQALDWRRFDRLELLCDYPRDQVESYLDWLRLRTDTAVELHPVSLPSPMDFGAIYRVVRDRLTALIGATRPPKLTFHLSPGTPAMAAVWILLAKSRFPAELIQSSREHGVRVAEVPFDIAAEFLPDLLSRADRRLTELSAGKPPERPAFQDILHRSTVMQRLIARADRVARRSVPVLIEGESGTGKELLARAIHHAGPRASQPFIPINCGAIPAALIEAQLFGHRKGAFTGATRDHPGVFEAAHGGTLLLDELGELPLNAQVNLLRVLQEGEIIRIGETNPRAVDVRIIAATNRDLTAEVAAGRFREDLFYRLAVAVLKLPPLRDREGDLGLLIDRLLEQINEEGREDPDHTYKQLSAGARNVLLNQPWPGNVRELLNTLRRAVLWSENDTLTEADIREALLPHPGQGRDTVLDRTLGDGFDLQALLGEVAGHYLRRALQETGGNKTRAAELIGLPSYQTLSNWLEKYGIKDWHG